MKTAFMVLIINKGSLQNLIGPFFQLRHQFDHHASESSFPLSSSPQSVTNLLFAHQEP